jgi:hypothetical protein
MGRLILFLSKKIKSSSLTEVVIATTILLTVFAISIFTLNNIMQSSLKNQKNQIDFLIAKHMYLYKNDKINIPFFSLGENVSITINKIKIKDIDWVEFVAKNRVTNKEVSKRILLKKNDKE